MNRRSHPSNNQSARDRIAEIVEILEPFRRATDRFKAEPVDMLVITILSQNTSDINSERAYVQLRATYPTWDDVADADTNDIAEAIRSGGLANQKARTIIEALRTLRENHGGFDLDRFTSRSDDELLAELTAIKGVGVKTAVCVLMFSLERDLCAVDTHIHRVLNRLGIVNAPTPEKTFEDLRPLVPRGMGRSLHVSLIRFGRTICKAQRPHCFECPLYDHCEWPRKEEVAHDARPGARAVSGDLLLTDVLRAQKSKPR